LANYEGALGQRLNKDKTLVFFNRNTNPAQQWFFGLSGIPKSQHFDMYLGLPALVGKSHINDFQNIIDRVQRRVSYWKTRFMSLPRKEILLKATVQAIPMYIMRVFLLLKELCRELNSIMQKF
jgi:hypothetical protein